MAYKGSNQRTIRERNRKLIFKVLLENGAMTRAGLASLIGISKPAVSKNVDELILDGFIKESGKESDSGVGKKGIILEVDKDILHLLAIDISKNMLNFAISDIFSNILYEKHFSINDKDTIDKFLNKLKADCEKYNVNMVSVSFAGVVKKDEITRSKMELKELYFEKILPVISFVGKENIVIRNDLNNSVLAEREYGLCKDDKNAVLISCDNGVGAGIIINNMIYEGDSFAAGEIGYINSSVEKDDEYRFLEDRLSKSAIEKAYSKKKGKQQEYDDFKSDLKKDKKKARALYATLLKELSASILTVLSVLDINKCVITGSLFELRDDFVESLEKAVNEVSPFEIRLLKSELKDASLKGAILTGIDEFYEKIQF